MEKCKACGKKLIWAKDEQGTLHPLDAVAPVYLMWYSSDDMCARAGTNGRLRAYVSHFATCPAATGFSKKRKKSGGKRERKTEDAGKTEGRDRNKSD